MRFVFVGPSLHGVTWRPEGLIFCSPAVRGDIARAVRMGATWIGLIDGRFGSCASVWHKEILHALSAGCHVWGAASMGALRAAECAPFGMVPVGAIARLYANGQLSEDAEVALLHGPQEVDYAPLTEPMVDVRATIEAMVEAGVLSTASAANLEQAASSVHFADRTLETMLAGVRPQNRGRLASLYEAHRVRAKQADALELLSLMSGAHPVAKVESWKLAHSASLMEMLGSDARVL